jgi:probable blue pigment (indigoidine) exporter
LALFNFGLFFPLLAVAVYRLPGGVAAAVGGLQPLLVAVVAWLAFGRRPRGRELAVGAAAVLGVALVVVRPGAAFDAVGVLAAVGANVSFSIGVVLTKRFPPPGDRLAATGRQLLLGGVLLVPLTLMVEGLPPVPTGAALAGFAYLGLGATALAFVLWFNGVRRLPTAAPPLLGLAAPVTGATLGWALLGQSLSPLQLAGFALTLAAIAYGAALGATPEVEPDREALARGPVVASSGSPAPAGASGSGDPVPDQGALARGSAVVAAGAWSASGAGRVVSSGKRGARGWRPNSARMAASAALSARRWAWKRGTRSAVAGSSGGGLRSSAASRRSAVTAASSAMRSRVSVDAASRNAGLNEVRNCS